MTIRTTVSITIAVGALALAGCGSSGSSSSSSTPSTAAAPTAAAGPVAVSIKDFKYAPDNASVKVGDKVTWTNEDSAPHTATAQGAFDTGTLNQGQSKTVTLTKAGTFNYICTFHPYMKATLTVSQ